MKKNGKGGYATNLYGKAYERQISFITLLKAKFGDHYNFYNMDDPEFRTVDGNYHEGYFISIRNKKDNSLVGYAASQFRFYDLAYYVYGATNPHGNDKIGFSKVNGWKPDDVFLDIRTNKLYIFEKKEQSVSGSVDEKIEGFPVKQRLWRRFFEKQNLGLLKRAVPTVELIGLLNSDWFLDPKRQSSYSDLMTVIEEPPFSIKIWYDQYDFDYLHLS